MHSAGIITHRKMSNNRCLNENKTGPINNYVRSDLSPLTRHCRKHQHMSRNTSRKIMLTADCSDLSNHVKFVESRPKKINKSSAVAKVGAFCVSFSFSFVFEIKWWKITSMVFCFYHAWTDNASLREHLWGCKKPASQFTDTKSSFVLSRAVRAAIWLCMSLQVRRRISSKVNLSTHQSL